MKNSLFFFMMMVPLAVMLAVFPYSALSTVPVVVPSEREADCAFVTLTVEEEAKALVAARGSWRTDMGVSPDDGAALQLGRLPDRAVTPVLNERAPSREPVGVRTVGCPIPLLPPSRAAAPACVLPATEELPEVPAPAFSREEMLEFSEK